MSLLIGLSGKLCAGKNAAGAILEEAGFLVLDVDRLGHRALDEAKAELAARFGPAALGADGEVDRRELGRIAFADRRALADLESIVHPAANRLAEEWEAANAGRDRCVNAALLHRMPLAKRLDAVIVVEAPALLRLRRALSRDGLGIREALERMLRQRGFSRALRSLGRPILRVGNAGSREALRAGVMAALGEIRRGADGAATGEESLN